MKKIILFGIIACTVLSTTVLLNGCGEKEIVKVKDETVAPDFAIKENVDIDWDQVKSDCEDTLNEDDYPLGSYLDYAVNSYTQTIVLIWPLKAEATKEDAIVYGEAYIKAFNDAMATQNFAIERSSDNYYGGLWEQYNINLQVYREDDIMLEDKYFVNQTIAMGSYDPVVPQVSADASESSAGDESVPESK